MTEIKPIYYSEKTHRYYFNSINAFGDYQSVTVYNCEALKGGEIKVDKNSRKYILGLVENTLSKNGRMYYRCTGAYIPEEKEEENNTPVEQACSSSRE